MKKINCIFIAFLSFFVCSTGFTQQNKQYKKKNADEVHKKNYSSFKKSIGEIIPQSLVVPYTFSYSTGTYTDLTSPISLNNGLTWDDPTFIIPIGFNFTLWNSTINSISINGWWLGGTLTPSISGIEPFISYFPDLTDHASDTNNWSGMPGSLSPISYQVTGTSGSQILKVEWKNAGFYNDISDDNVSTDLVSLQIWLYESSNNIEIHFGPSSITQPALAYDGNPGPLIGVGLYDYNVDTLDMFCIEGNASSPTTTILDETGLFSPTLTSDPPNGIIYKFAWSASGIFDPGIKNNFIDVFPNPVLSSAAIRWQKMPAPKKVKMEVCDVTGRVVMQEIFNPDQEGTINVNFSSLISGIYLLKMESEESGIICKKLIKQ